MEKNSKIAVFGSTGLVGSAVARYLEKNEYYNVITISRKLINHRGIEYGTTNYSSDFDLRKEKVVNDIFEQFNPEYVINCSGKVGGINANNIRSAEFIYDNIMIQTNIIDACHKFSTKKTMIIGSSCIYPRNCPQPIKEQYLLTSELEETNIGYALAKITGLTMARLYRKQYGDNFISAMPTNLYGEGDSFNLENSHVLPALIRKFHEAKVNNLPNVEFWGTGTPRREFLYVDDLAEALVFLMNNYNESEHINIGTGKDVTIRELAYMLKDIISYEGEIIWNTNYPDGTPIKRLDVTKIEKLGWQAKTSLEEGLKITYKWFVNNYDTLRK